MRRRLRGVGCCGLVGGVLTAACGDVSAPPPESVEFWEAELAPIALAEPDPHQPGISGNAAAIVRANGTEAGLAIEGVPEGATYRWGVYGGDCDAPSDLLPAAFGYPPLTVQQPDATVHLAARLVQSNSYHVAVSTDGDGERVSCGELVHQP